MALDNIQNAPDGYARPDPIPEVNWRWLQLWDQENPCPGAEDFEAWYVERRKMQDRSWVAWCLPQFLVWDWSDADVETARRLVARHVCGVCGRADDPGCWLGC